MRCSYCFYLDSINHQDKNFTIMTQSTVEAIIRRAFSFPTSLISFAFQGGEPLLAGLDYFRQFVDTVNHFNKQLKKKIEYSIQTNGYGVNEEWSQFFSDNNFLVGVSIDGLQGSHDKNRIDSFGFGTFDKVISATKLLKKTQVKFNVLTVINADNAHLATEIYQSYKKLGFKHQQYIPCIDFVNQKRGLNTWSLTPELLLTFLKDLFDVYRKDMMNKDYIYISNFDNYEGILAGIEAQSCSFTGRCSNQLVIEADGTVYPCDFYVRENYVMGNINEDSLKTIIQSEAGHRFITESIPDRECIKCKWGFLCRGGCRRYRDEQRVVGVNYFCQAYYQFFEYAYEDMKKINTLWL